jgi:hypothetical protein
VWIVSNLAVLRAKVAAERPAWAAASQPVSARPPIPQNQIYSQIKAQIVEQAQKPEIPSDPEERYLYERRQEARRNREMRQEEQREDDVREALRQRLIAEKQNSDDVEIERVLRIRKALEARLCQTLQPPENPSLPRPLLTDGGPLRLGTTAPSMGYTPEPLPPAPLSTGILEPMVSPIESGPSTRSREGGGPLQDQSLSTGFGREFVESLMELDPEERKRGLQEFFRARRALLKPRAETLEPRRPTVPKRANAFALAAGDAAESLEMSMEDRPKAHSKSSLEFSAPATRKKNSSL